MCARAAGLQSLSELAVRRAAPGASAAPGPRAAPAPALRISWSLEKTSVERPNLVAFAASTSTLAPPFLLRFRAPAFAFSTSAATDLRFERPPSGVSFLFACWLLRVFCFSFLRRVRRFAVEIDLAAKAAHRLSLYCESSVHK